MQAMGTIYLVRHGQASFGSDDYDRLSERGLRQCRALGEWFAARGLGFDAALRGSLRRHAQSLEAIAEGHGAAPGAQVAPGLDEYDADAIVRALLEHPVARTAFAQPLPPPTTPEGYKQHFRALREGMARWIAGELAPAGMPAFADWQAAIEVALEQARAAAGPAGRVLVVSSGGPIATAVACVLKAPAETLIELNMQLRNSAVSELHFSPRRTVLVGFNHVPHLAPDEITGA